jgi:hypothetical protein
VIKIRKWIEIIGNFCLGFSLTGIYGLLDGVTLSIAIIIMFNQIMEIKE